MKQKVIVCGLCLTLAFSLVSCGGQQAQEPQQTESVQQSEPVISEPPVTAQPLEVKQEGDTETPPVEERQGVEDGSSTAEGAVGEEPTTLDNVELFTDCNEVVYATGTVNIRESWSADSTKLGSLSAGQSVTRTGNAIVGMEAEGWSRVQLSDGTIAFISTSYLSTTKPVSRPAGTTTSGTQQTQQTQQTPQPSTGTQQTQQTPQPSSNKAGWNQAFYDTLNAQQKAVYEGLDAAGRANMQSVIEQQRNLTNQGYYGGGDLTQEQVEDTWGQIHVGS